MTKKESLRSERRLLLTEISKYLVFFIFFELLELPLCVGLAGHLFVFWLLVALQLLLCLLVVYQFMEFKSLINFSL